MRLITIIILLATIPCIAQSWQVINHLNNRRKAIQVDSVLISDYVYSEISELSEKKAYVAQGELYAYINEQGQELTPYVFAVAHNFENGYAIVGDSTSQSVLNDKMQLILPLEYARVRLPIQGLIVVQSHAGLWGVFDVMGNAKLPFIYDLPPHIITRNTIIVRREEEYGVVDEYNTTKYNCSYQYITPHGYAYRSGKYLKLSDF